MAGGKGPRRWRRIYLLLLVPVVATLWVPIYNRAEPSFAGIPFFYWYQLVWVPLAALILFIVYRADEARGPAGGIGDVVSGLGRHFGFHCAVRLRHRDGLRRRALAARAILPS